MVLFDGFMKDKDFQKINHVFIDFILLWVTK